MRHQTKPTSHTLFSLSEPESFRMKFQSVEEPKKKGEMWQFRAIAQLYNTVNDKLFIFRYGSAQKTIAERVAANKVPIFRGHPWVGDDRTTVGRVTAASESREDGGLVYTGLISASEDELVQKMSERIIVENSIEAFMIRESIAEVSIDEVPVQSRSWARIAPTGLAEIREVLEFMWAGVGLMSTSSQGIDALLEEPRLVPFCALPVSTLGRTWNPEAARERVNAWAGTANTAHARLSRAFLMRGETLTVASPDGDGHGVPSFVGQFADVEGDELVIVPEALDRLASELPEILASDPKSLAAAMLQLGRYRERILTNAEPVVETQLDTTVPATPDASPESSESSPKEVTSQPGPPASAASAVVPPTEDGTTEETLDDLLKRVEAAEEEIVGLSPGD